MGRSVSYPSGAIVAFTVLGSTTMATRILSTSGCAMISANALPQPFRRLRPAMADVAARTGSSGATPSPTSGSRSTVASLPYGSLNAKTGPIGTPTGAPPVHPGRSNGFARSRLALTSCSATMNALAACRTAKACTADARPDRAQARAPHDASPVTSERHSTRLSHGLRHQQERPWASRRRPQPGFGRPVLAWPPGPCLPAPACRSGFPLRVRTPPQAGPDGLSLAQP